MPYLEVLPDPLGLLSERLQEVWEALDEQAPEHLPQGLLRQHPGDGSHQLRGPGHQG